MADTAPRSPKTGAPMHRDMRPMKITYRGKSITIDMPGWYADDSDEGVHTGADMKVSDRALHRLKAESEGLLLPEDIKTNSQETWFVPGRGGAAYRRRSKGISKV